MSNYLKIFQRSVLCLAVLLFVVPLVTHALFPEVGTVIKSLSLKVWVTDLQDRVIKPLVVGNGIPFKINWSAKGKDMGGGEVTTGITCKNNWGESTASSGSSEGVISGARAFIITCSGLGAGKNKKGQVNVGATDLVVSSLSLAGQKSKEANTFFTGPYSIKTSVKNIGKLSFVESFRVKYTAANDALMTMGLSTVGDIIVTGGMNGSATQRVTDLRLNGAVGGPWYYKVCVNLEGDVFEHAGLDNNCSPIIGPYKFVNP